MGRSFSGEGNTCGEDAEREQVPLCIFPTGVPLPLEQVEEGGR